MALKLNLGCGRQTPATWINVDYAAGAKLAKLPLFRILNQRFGLLRTRWSEDVVIHDLRKRFPWPSGSIDIIYTSHTLEHFSRQAGYQFLQECHRVLKPHGILRIVVPDLAPLVEHYIHGTIRADQFLDRLEVGYEKSADGLLMKSIAPFLRAPHKCMYDTPTLIAILGELGFEAERKAPFVSAIPDILNVELSERTTEAVVVEATKTA